jgi:hypothetical protein
MSPLPKGSRSPKGNAGFYNSGLFPGSRLKVHRLVRIVAVARKGAMGEVCLCPGGEGQEFIPGFRE